MTATTPRKTAASKALATKQAEAVEKTEADEPQFNTFEYKAETYSVPADPRDVPLEVVYAETEYEIIEQMVGAEQWLKFRATRPSVRDFGVFADLVTDAAGQGGDEGN